MANKFLDDVGLTYLWSKLKAKLAEKADTGHSHSNASTSAAGFMSTTDKTKLNATNVAYGTCSTAAATAAKVITISGNTNWVLSAGSIITVKFSATNTAQNPTFNVNGTGAKSVWYSAALITTGSLSYAGYKNRPSMYMYDGTQYVFLGWAYDSNTTYSNASLGQGYGTCSTAAATAAKVVSLSSYALTTGGVVAVKFTYGVPASATLNINSKGAKAIYYKGAAITAGIIEAGDIATFIYNGSQYHLLTVDRHRFFSTLVPYGVSIGESANLNTTEYLKVGNYYCSSNATTATLTNCPTTSAFMMTVSSPLSTSIDNETTKTWVYRLRKLQVYTGQEYVQYCYAGGTAGTWTYGDWTKVIKSTDTATTSAAGLMSPSDKVKLNGIEEGANKTTVDSALSSSSTNPVQNKVVNTAITALNELVGDTPVAEQIENALSGSNVQLTPSFANSIEECTDTSKVYVLPDGYIYAYMATEGRPYTNLVPTSTVWQGTDIFNGVGYKDGYYGSGTSDGVDANYTVTGFIPYTAVNGVYPSIYVKGLSWVNESHSRFILYNESGQIYGANTIFNMIGTNTNLEANFTVENLGDAYWKLTPQDALYTNLTAASLTITHFRFSLKGSGANLKITFDEPIDDDISYSWKNTGHAFVPLDEHSSVMEVNSLTGSGWWRIAQSDVNIGNCLGTFNLYATTTRYHSNALITAGTNYGSNTTALGDSNKICVLHCGHSGGASIMRARIISNTETGGYAYLEIMLPYSTTSNPTDLRIELSNNVGWSLITPTTVSGLPTGYSTVVDRPLMNYDLSRITATVAEINKLQGLTATTAELNYVDGVTSNIQTQLNELAARIAALEA